MALAARLAVTAMIVAVGVSSAVVAQAGTSQKTRSDAAVPASKLGEPTFTPRPLPPGGYHLLSEGLDVVPIAGTAPPGTLSLPDAAKKLEAREGAPAADAPSGHLARVSDGDFGTPYNGNETTFRNRLSWVLTFANAVPVVRGPSYLTSAEREKIAAGLRCTDTGIVDASSGAVVTYFQDCKAG